jgi:hypothetical protein
MVLPSVIEFTMILYVPASDTSLKGPAVNNPKSETKKLANAIFEVAFTLVFVISQRVGAIGGQVDGT